MVYADDVLIVTNSPEKLQNALDIFQVLCTQLGLSVNAKKFYTMHLGANPRSCRDTVFTLNQVLLAFVLENDPIECLGKPIGFQLINDHSQFKEFFENAEILLKSALAPWQKLDTLKSFYYPSLQYAQRTQQIKKQDWAELDDSIRQIIKKDVINVPERATNNYLYGSSTDTLFGIPLASEDSDIALIDGAFKLLTSEDELVRNLAWKDLTATVQHRLRTGHRNKPTPPPVATLDSLTAFLSGKSFRA